MGNQNNENNHLGIEYFQESLDILKINGFKPIAVTQMFFEETFVFETDEEATAAFEKFEKFGTGTREIMGWWYGKDNFLKTVEEYEKDFDTKVKIYWLNNENDSTEM